LHALLWEHPGHGSINWEVRLDSLVLEVQLTRSETARTVRERAFRLPQFKLLILVSLLIALIGLLDARLPGRGFFFWGGAYLLLLLLLNLITVPLVRWRLDTDRGQPHRVGVSEENLQLQTASANIALSWPAVSEVTETGRCYVVRWRGRGTIAMIPKWAFASPGDEDAFRELVSRKSKARFLPPPDDAA
jgi:YcxB-like protein